MRLIDADALEENIKRVFCANCNSYEGVMCRACGTDDALDLIEDAPTVVAGQDTSSDCDTCAVTSCKARAKLRRVNCPLWRAKV